MADNLLSIRVWQHRLSADMIMMGAPPALFGDAALVLGPLRGKESMRPRHRQEVHSMRIVSCPKGGRVPEGYCRQSCLNYPGTRKAPKRQSLRALRGLFVGDGRSWLEIYKQDIAPKKKKRSCRVH